MLVIRNIGELFLGDGRSIRNASLRIENGRILDFGAEGEESLDAGGGSVIPGLIDSHTHLVFAGTRSEEFVMRAKGMSYPEIANAGGGIWRTVEAGRSAGLEELG